MNETSKLRITCAALSGAWAVIWLTCYFTHVPPLFSFFARANPWFAVATIVGAIVVYLSAQLGEVVFARGLALVVGIVGISQIPVSPATSLVLMLLSGGMVMRAQNAHAASSWLTRCAFLIALFELMTDAAGLTAPSIHGLVVQMGPAAGIGILPLTVATMCDEDIRLNKVPFHGKLYAPVFKSLLLCCAMLALIMLTLREIYWHVGIHEILAFSIIPIAFAQVIVTFVLYTSSLRLQSREAAQCRRRQSVVRYAAKVQRLYEQAPFAFLEVSDGKVHDCNEMLYKWLGYSAQQLLGQPIHAILTPESSLYFDRHVSMVVNHGWFDSVELNFIRRDGDIFQAVASLGSSAAAAKNRVLMILREPAVNQERIDVLQRIEDHYLLLRDMADEYAIVTANAAGEIIDWSAHAEAIFGIMRCEAHNMPFSYLYTAPTSNGSLFSSAMAEALAAGRQTHECWLQTKSGNKLKARVSVEAVSDDPNSASAYLIVIKVLSSDMVPTGNGALSNLKLLSEVEAAEDRQEVASFFSMRTGEYLQELLSHLRDQNVRSSEEVCRQLEKLFTCIGCEPMTRAHSQLQSYIRHHDWQSAQQAVATMHAILDGAPSGAK